MRSSFLFLALLSMGLLHAQKKAMPFGTSKQRTLADCTPPTSSAELNVNNVRATILSGGDMWWDLQGSAKYEIPKGSGKNAFFLAAFWMGGVDKGGNLHMAAQTYRQNGERDFSTGPLSSAATIDPAECKKYDKVYSITQTDITAFIKNGKLTPDIVNWPAHGDPSKGEAKYLAPFRDVDGDGLYDPAKGDYPTFVNRNPPCKIVTKDEQMLWWVFNDAGSFHHYSQADQIGLEVQATAFAFSSEGPLNNTTFYNFKFINRGAYQLDSTYLGLNIDPDLGYAFDDYIGCDVGRSLGYCYNGVENDIGALGYGHTPPAVGIDFFEGPRADANDKLDNNHNNVVDEAFETIGLTKFVYYNNDASVQGNPTNGTGCYRYLQGKWKDGKAMTYGGNGRNVGSGATNLPCNYMFPSKTDSSFSTPWTEESAGNAPGDRRFLMSAGAFTMKPGAVNYFTYSVVWARADSSKGASAKASLDSLIKADDIIQTIFDECFKVIYTSDVSSLKSSKELSIQAFPNPFSQKTHLNFSENFTGVIEMYDIYGKRVLRKTLVGTELEIERENLASGIYFYKASGRANGILTNTSGKLVIQ